MTRITQRSIQESTLANLQRNLQGMATIQEQLSSQKRINRPSDDPTGTVSALTLRSDLRSTEQHRRNADDGNAWLTATDSTLQTVTTQLNRVRTLTVHALNTGASGAEGGAADAVEIEGIRDSILGLANTDYLGRAIFAGTAAGSAYEKGASATYGTAPATYASSSYAWGGSVDGSGAAVPVERKVAADATVRVDTDGRQVFGSGEDSVFALLDKISTFAKTASADPVARAALSTALGDLDTRMSKVRAAQSDIGARQNRVEYAQQQADDRKVSLNTSLSQVESIDLPATIVALQSQQTAYQAALGATAKVLQPSLMDFLR